MNFQIRHCNNKIHYFVISGYRKRETQPWRCGKIATREQNLINNGKARSMLIYAYKIRIPTDWRTVKSSLSVRLKYLSDLLVTTRRCIKVGNFLWAETILNFAPNLYIIFLFLVYFRSILNCFIY